MQRTMSIEDFKVWKALAEKYAIAWELVGMGYGWVCIRIG